VKPLLATTGSAEATGLAIRLDHCKRLLPPQADSDVGSGILRDPNTLSPYATWEYSRIRPPSRSRRRTRAFAPGTGGCGRRTGEALLIRCAAPRCCHRPAPRHQPRPGRGPAPRRRRAPAIRRRLVRHRRLRAVTVHHPQARRGDRRDAARWNPLTCLPHRAQAAAGCPGHRHHAGRRAGSRRPGVPVTCLRRALRAARPGQRPGGVISRARPRRRRPLRGPDHGRAGFSFAVTRLVISPAGSDMARS
jgi:hypothetical protein